MNVLDWMERRSVFMHALTNTFAALIVLIAAYVAYRSVELQLESAVAEERRALASGVSADLRVARERLQHYTSLISVKPDTSPECMELGFRWSFIERNLDRIGKLQEPVASRTFDAYYTFEKQVREYAKFGVCSHVASANYKSSFQTFGKAAIAHIDGLMAMLAEIQRDPLVSKSTLTAIDMSSQKKSAEETGNMIEASKFLERALERLEMKARP